ncbi:MAG: hypothetical protein RLZZ50_1521 [Verrucomicrobiota bacterium]
MGNFLRLAFFVLALGALAAGTGALLLQERQQERALEQAAASDAAMLEALRASHIKSQRAILGLSALALLCLVAVAAAPAQKAASASDTDQTATRAEMRGLENLARATNAQRIELDHEREARHRSEQDLHLQQLLANHALQDKIRLGRDLHDGLVQSLYAAGLMLETASQQLHARPANADEAGRLIERAKATLNAAIREARGTIGGLTPDALEEQSFPDAVRAVLDHLDGGRLRERRVSIAPELPAFAAPARTELLQIIREAASNALRHGEAAMLEVSFSPLPDERLRLVIRDDGRGFDPALVTRGHGLVNLADRARNLGAGLELESTPGRGTVVTLTLPASVA